MTKPASQATTKAGLLRRAQLVAQLQHPNLTRLLPLPGGAGLTPVLKGLQRLGDFADAEAPFGRLQLEHSLQLLLDVLSGLGALHELRFAGEGFVHGAVSPAQICIDGHGSGRLIPLLSSHVIATLAPESNGYAAPELLLGGNVDRRADLFSVGVLLWEALAGRRLFTDVSPAAVLARCSSDSLPGLVTPAHAQWARPLCAVAARAVSIQAADRFDSAGSFSAAIIGAAGPRLTSKLGESWQDEAPTLVPRRGTYVPPLPPPPPRRSFTPPGVTIELTPEPELKAEPVHAAPLPPIPPPFIRSTALVPPVLDAAPFADPAPCGDPPPSSDVHPALWSVKEPPVQRGTLFTHAQVRSAVIALTGLSLVALAVWARPTREAVPVASAATPLATLAPAVHQTTRLVLPSAAAIPASIAVPARAACVPSTASTVIAPTAVSAPSAISATTATARYRLEPLPPRVFSAAKLQASKPAPKARSRPADSDYGI